MTIFAKNACAVGFFAIGLCATARADYSSSPVIAKDGTKVVLHDYATVPASTRGGSLANFNPSAPANTTDQRARPNFLRSDPVNGSRFYVNDLNRNLYLLDKPSKAFSPYLNFQGIFPKFDNDPGFAGGLVTFQFDPNYSNAASPGHGVFYTVHTEDPSLGGSAIPVNTNYPGLNVSGYATTIAINPPGTVQRQSVLVAWKDTNLADAVFQGSARELLRLGFNGNLHPMGDITFNPNQTGADGGNLYITTGDGGSGENPNPPTDHNVPQRLDSLLGKVLRIKPTFSSSSPTAVVNGYTSPSDNPFSTLSGTTPQVRPEIFAYGFRNPHRISWDAVSGKAFVDDIGLHSFEEVNILQAGGNYGYAEREGVEQMFVNIGGRTTSWINNPFTPAPPFTIQDSLTPMYSAVGPTSTSGMTDIASLTNTPIYPVATYSHGDGDAISSGFVYRGSRMPELYGKYIFGDITTGRIFYADADAMIAADDGNRLTLADVHEIQIIFDEGNRRVFDIVADEYGARGGDPDPGHNPNIAGKLPGRGSNGHWEFNGSWNFVGDFGAVGGWSGGNYIAAFDGDGLEYGGRADIRLTMGSDGELYLISKSDGMIRAFASIPEPVGMASLAILSLLTRRSTRRLTSPCLADA